MGKKYWVIFLMLILLGGTAACGKGNDGREVEDSLAEDSFEPETSTGVSEIQQSVQEDIVYGDVSFEGKTDVVLIMDESGSMAFADRERIAVEAAKMFIDMEKAAGINLSLVEFSNKITSTGLIEIEEKNDKDELKELLDQISYKGKAHTDTGAALQEAVSILNSSESTGKKAIILFTDGRTDIDDGTPGRTTEDSLDDVNAAMKEAGEQGYPIYSVGLNADGSVEESELNRLALNTGGDYRIAKDVNELPDFFNQIFMEMRNILEIKLDKFVADGNYRDIKINIENSNIVEANIVILHSDKLIDAKIYSPQDEEVGKGDSGVRFSPSEKYTVIKLIRPQTGDWILQVKGVSGDNIRISLLYNYDFTVTTMLSAREVKVGDAVGINLYLNSEGESIKGEEFYQAIAAEGVVENIKTGEARAIGFTASEDGLYGVFTPDSASDYELKIHLEGNGFYRDVEGMIVKVLAEGGEILQEKELLFFEVAKGKKVRVDLTEYISYQKGNSYSLSAASDIVKASLEEDVLVLEGIEVGDTVLELSPDGSDGNKAYVITVTCTEGGGVELLLIIAIAAAVVLLLCVLAIRKSGGKIDGKFKLGVKCWKEENGVTCKTDYTVSTGIEGRSMKSSKLSLEELLAIYQRYYNSVERDETKKRELGEILSCIRKHTKRVWVKGHEKGGKLKVQSKGGDAVKISNAQGIEIGKSVEINVNAQGNMLPQGKSGCNVKVEIPGGYVEIVIGYSMV